MSDALLDAGLALALLGAIFLPLEWARPAYPGQPRLRRGIAADLAFFAGQHLLFAAAAVAVLSWLSGHVLQFSSIEGLQGAFAGLPLVVRALVALLLGDLLMYWGHRLQHRVDLLWRFHAVHHTAERLDFLAAHREHPLDGLYTQTMMNLPAIVLGLPVAEVMGLVAFRGLWAIFIHANVGVRLGPLGLLLGSPELHHWHHERQREAGNYANLAPWIDRLFGTYRRPPGLPSALGIDEDHPRGYLGLLLHPFRRRGRATAPG